MRSIDTNVLVRLLVADDPKQSAAARALAYRVGRSGGTLFVPLTVVLELEWVLRSRYGYPKKAIVEVVASLLEARELEFQDEATLEQALHYYRSESVDFADCLHLAAAARNGRLPFITLDRKATRLPGATMLADA
jgi:predicted nucleic-acid-binding protein